MEKKLHTKVTAIALTLLYVVFSFWIGGVIREMFMDAKTTTEFITAITMTLIFTVLLIFLAFLWKDHCSKKKGGHK